VASRVGGGEDQNPALSVLINLLTEF